ncbi:MAG TPA: hypothetical protein VFT95_14075, partial [Micromonosporaceae bacterium]|nr:hypothetical protein [Micromonosporaceae bacterium]
AAPPAGPQPTPTGTSAPTSPPATASPAPSAGRSTTQGATERQISQAELVAAPVDLPDWPGDAPAACTTRGVRLGLVPTPNVPTLLELVYSDVDGDGTGEAITRLSCSDEVSRRQVVVFDRDAGGRIVTFGQVVRTGQDGILGIANIDPGPGGRVRALVTGSSGAEAPQQWRTYGWDGSRFRQTGGPTTFQPPVTPSPRFTVAATDLEYGPPDTGGVRRGTVAVTIENTGDATMGYPVIVFPRNDRDAAMHGDWAGCPSGGGRPDRVFCVTAPLAPGERRTLSFPFTTEADGPAGSATVRVAAGADSDGTPVPGTDVVVTYQVTFAS